MERTFILDLLTGLLGVLVFAFIWVGMFIGRKNVDWDNNHEAVGYIFMCILMAVATVGMILKAYFWFTEHIIYIP